jgi:hypothetical protein
VNRSAAGGATRAKPAKLTIVWSPIRRVILWDFPRASWQYDIIVAAIVLFIFLTPREWFHDQPKAPHSHEVALLPDRRGMSVFWLSPALVSQVPQNASESERLAKVSAILKTETGKAQNATRLDAIYNSERELTGYMAVAKP